MTATVNARGITLIIFIFLALVVLARILKFRQKRIPKTQKVRNDLANKRESANITPGGRPGRAHRVDLDRLI